MGKELKVHSDAAYEAAHRLAEEAGQSAGPLDRAARARPDRLESRAADEIIEAAKRDIAARRRDMTVDGEDIFSEAAIARRRARREALIAWINRDRPAFESSVDDEMYDENGLPI